MPVVHKKYGGSTAARTLGCPAWVNLAAEVTGPRRSSAAADRGSMLHDLMELHYDKGEPLDALIESHELTARDAGALRQARDTTEQYLDSISAHTLVCEALVSFSNTIGGSADLIARGPDTVAVIDYKFGSAAVTQPEQFLFYTWCAIETSSVADLFDGDVKNESVVIQPAVRKTPKIMPHTKADIAEFKQEFLIAVDKAESGTRETTPGEYCFFCPAKPICPSHRASPAPAAFSRFTQTALPTVTG